MWELWLKRVRAGLIVFGSAMNLLAEFTKEVQLVVVVIPWYGKAGWFMLLVASLVYVAIDWQNLFPKKK